MFTRPSEAMIINGLQLPLRLQESLKTGGWTRPGEGYSGRWHHPSNVAAFGNIFNRVEELSPQLFSFEGMMRVNEIWNQPEIANEYLGADSVTHPPGDIDPAKTIIIGECEPDGPIALDYRPSNPRVIYFCDIGPETLWVEAVESVDVLIDRLGLA